MRLDKTDDPRGFLEKLSRKELEYTAQFYGIESVKPGMPAELMRPLIAQANPPRIPTPVRQKIGMYAEQLRVPPYDIWKHTQFGEQAPVVQEPEKAEEVDALADLKRQWESELNHLHDPVKSDEPSVPSVKKKKKIPKIVLLRRECKAKGIKWERTDKAVDLEAKLNGENTSECSQ